MINTAGLAYPKKAAKKKRKKHPKSIIPQTPGACYLCSTEKMDARQQYTEEHHIFDGPRRALSEEYGLKVRLCPQHHRIGPQAVHNDAKRMRLLQRIGQMAFEQEYGHEKFMEIFGKDYR